MLEKVFLQVLNMSFTASFVIIFVLFARFFLGRAPKVLSYALWGLVLFRLLCPFSIESSYSLLPVKANPISQDIVYQALPAIDTGIEAINQAVNSSLPPANPEASINPIQLMIFNGTLIWLLGIAILLVYSLISLMHLRKQVRTASHEEDNIYLAHGIKTPFVLGIIKPKIYLPASLTDEEKEYIVLHEKLHIKRFDHLVKLVAFFALCLHWFNPLVWLAFFLSSRDMEMSCDEAVIKILGSEVKKDYSSSLLALATGHHIIGAGPLAFGEGDTKKRIKNVLSYKKTSLWLILAALVIIIILAISLMLNPASDKEVTISEEVHHKERIAAYLEAESREAFAPYYELLDFIISNYKEDKVKAGDDEIIEATFFYTIISKNYDRDPDSVEYILEAKKNKSPHYQQLYDEYLEPREMNFDLKITIDSQDQLTLYSNIAGKGIEWQETQMSDYILK